MEATQEAVQPKKKKERSRVIHTWPNGSRIVCWETDTSESDDENDTQKPQPELRGHNRFDPLLKEVRDNRLNEEEAHFVDEAIKQDVASGQLEVAPEMQQPRWG